MDMKTNKFLQFFSAVIMMSAFVSCSGDDENDGNGALTSAGINTPEENPDRVKLQTRSTDGSSQDVAVGIYMVDKADDGTSGLLQSAGNYIDNTMLSYIDGVWIPSSPINWKDKITPADFFAYAPYDAELTDARSYAFSVAVDQTSSDSFMRSDFLYGSLLGQKPTNETLTLTLSHLLSQIIVVVEPGSGFGDGELRADDVSVSFGGSKLSSVIDLADGKVSATGTAQDVKCYNNGDLTFKAIVVPQKITFTNLVRIEWNGSEYVFQNSFDAESGKLYKITLKVNKTNAGINVGIAGWDISDEDFGGVAE